MGTRIITGIVGIALAAFIIQTGGWIFSTAVLLLSLGAWFEFARAFVNKGIKLAYFTGLAMIILIWGCSWLGNDGELVAVSVLTVLLVLSHTVFEHKSFSIEQACVSAAGIFYVGLAFAHLILLRFTGEPAMVSTSLGNLQLGCAWIWTALIGTWASDTFAYFTGSLLGRHKLCPEISPNKTIEGFVGGIIGTMLSVTGLGVLFSFPLLPMAGLGLCIALVATLGDLVESVIKRATGIKDSGSLIPGHGGILDRFDSVMFTVPFVYYFVQIFKIAG